MVALAGAALLPAAGLYWLGSGIHRLARSRVRRRLPLPTVAVGGLTSGGEGKTPLAAWIAARLREHGRNPAIVMRGYGGDEQLVHRELVDGITVVCDADRSAGARRALQHGADSLVLDDAFQHTELAPDLNVAIVAAEYLGRRRLLLPAGRWRERLTALGRADAVVVTRKTASDEAVSRAVWLAARWAKAPPFVARLEISHFSDLLHGGDVEMSLTGRNNVFALAGIANAAAFFEQLQDISGTLSCRRLPDHHRFSASSVRSLEREANRAGAEYVVVTLKDAVKLRHNWPRDSVPVLVARQRLVWEVGGREFEDLVRTAAASDPVGYIS